MEDEGTGSRDRQPAGHGHDQEHIMLAVQLLEDARQEPGNHESQDQKQH